MKTVKLRLKGYIAMNQILVPNAEGKCVPQADNEKNLSWH